VVERGGSKVITPSSLALSKNSGPLRFDGPDFVSMEEKVMSNNCLGLPSLLISTYVRIMLPYFSQAFVHCYYVYLVYFKNKNKNKNVLKNEFKKRFRNVVNLQLKAKVRTKPGALGNSPAT